MYHLGQGKPVRTQGGGTGYSWETQAKTHRQTRRESASGTVF